MDRSGYHSGHGVDCRSIYGGSTPSPDSIFLDPVSQKVAVSLRVLRRPSRAFDDQFPLSSSSSSASMYFLMRNSYPDSPKDSMSSSSSTYMP